MRRGGLRRQSMEKSVDGKMLLPLFFICPQTQQHLCHHEANSPTEPLGTSRNEVERPRHEQDHWRCGAVTMATHCNIRVLGRKSLLSSPRLGSVPLTNLWHRTLSSLAESSVYWVCACPGSVGPTAIRFSETGTQV